MLAILIALEEMNTIYENDLKILSGILSGWLMLASWLALLEIMNMTENIPLSTPVNLIHVS